MSLRQRMRSHGEAHGQDGHPRVWSPYKSGGIKCHLPYRAFQTPIDSQAIFTILPANLFGYALAGARPILLCRDRVAAFKVVSLPQGPPRRSSPVLLASATTTALRWTPRSIIPLSHWPNGVSLCDSEGSAARRRG